MSKPDALALAEALQDFARDIESEYYTENLDFAAAELRRLHAEGTRLHSQNAFLLEQKQKAEVEAKHWFTLTQQLQQDAERYRWLKEQGHKGGGDFYFRATGRVPRDKLDAAIDAAMKEANHG